MNRLKTSKNRKGFTLAEMLITVMILVILFALAVPAVFTIQRNLRQKELDQKAQTIYTAVQNRLSELYATGNSNLYNPELHTDILTLGDFPGDYDDTIDGNKLTKDSVYYITSDSEIGKELFEGVFDETLYNRHWVVEILPYVIDETDNSKQITAATVYAVYYSEDVISVNEEYATNGKINDSYLNAYRFKNKRIATVAKGGTDARVGYYGGSSLGSSSGTTNLSITDIQIYSNEEVETAVVKARKPGSVTEKAEFTFKLSDAYGHTYTITYDDESKRFVADGKDITNTKTIKVSRIGVNYTFIFTLDDLSSDNTRFNKLFGENSGHGENNLVSGSDIKLEATISSKDQTASSDTKYALGNSLFAYNDTGSKDAIKKDYAEITCARHLQNLDTTSNVTGDIKTATLMNDISFKEDSDFYEEYAKGYFNGKITTNKMNTNGSISSVTTPNYKGIQNEHLTVLNGGNYSIYNLTTSTGGLFDTVTSTLAINDLKLVGEKVDSNTSVGSFIGTVTSTGEVTITNSSSYISSANNDIPSVITSDMNLESFRFLQGNTVGGLVGTNEGSLTIDSSFASSVLGKEGSTTGGLVGKNNGTLAITKAYSDSYLYGKDVAGLVGVNNKTLNVTSAYVAGFIGLDNNEDALGAGLVLGQATNMQDVYTIIACYNVDQDNGMKKNSDDPFVGKYYSTAINNINRFSHVYYLRGSTNDADNIEGTNAITDAKNMKFSDTSEFVIDTSLTTTPYRLMGQSLTSYTYPRFKELDHYGDWDVSFVSGALVYYEQYKTDNGTYYGFDGAGVDISLTGNDTIIGDGYGVIVKESQSSIPDTFEVKINGSSTKTINTKTDTYFTVTKYNETYRIYPLSKEEVNVNRAIDGYYERVSISSSDSDTKYFDFNPHFARSVVDVDSENSPTSAIPSEISIRSPRHLNNLSKYYDDGYKQIVGNKTYRQERDMIYSSYDWANYTSVSSVTSQEPIGKTTTNAFSATYDGGSYTIGDLSFITSSGNYVGMFGYSTGTIKNVVLATQYTKDGKSYRVQRTEAARTNETVYYGVLVGKNSGTVSNSAVAGYYLSGKDGTIHGYANSTIYVGGLVGYNEGTITDSAADGPKLSLSMYRSTCYAAGLVGYNTGSVTNSYALNHISSDVSEGTTIIAGFAAYNAGSIRQSYSATALTSQGTGSYAYAFAPREGSGSVSESYYLYNGSYEFVDGLYAYDRNDASSSGTAKKYQELKSMRGNRIATKSEYNKLTKDLDKNETVYPYRAVIKDSSGNYVHYGEWQVKPSLGVFGVFYWEHEDNGQNNGYKITYIGTSYGEVKYRSTLCDSHDDGGEITEYGYGYYVGEDFQNEVSYSLNGIAMSDNNNINSNAKAALESQIPGIKFYPHTTKSSADGDYIYLSGTSTNGTITLTKDRESYSFTISPFFGNAISLNNGKKTSDEEANQHINNTPGLSANPYEIRSAKQLQFINWNSASKDSSSLVTKDNYSTYNFLMNCGGHTSSGDTVTKTNAGNASNSNLVFNQSHDLNAEGITDFSPIAGQGKGTSTTSSYTSTLYAWFGGTFNGQSYKIQELNITSKAFSVGLFGTTAGATIENTILYSTKGATIERNTENTDEQGAYSLGGLVGVAYDYKNAIGNAITNCAIAGYNIVDNSKNKQGLGEANVGGLVGVANVNVEKCSSVVNIAINATHKDAYGNFTKAEWGNYIRVGGITGAVQDSVTNCYSGGTITVGEETLDETYSNSTHIGQNEVKDCARTHSTNVFLSGIAGGAFTMNYQNFTGNTDIYDGTPKVTNCYTYMKFPAMRGTIRNITMFACVSDRYENASSVVTNCYYLESSADIDMSQLPKYKLNTNSVSSIMNDYYKQKMLTGSATWMYKMFNNNNGSDRGTFTNVESRSYAELSSSNMITTLGSAFAVVNSTDESGQIVDGKYSFPAGNSALSGKNYPFPAVVTQTGNDSFVPYVHYGEWPFSGAHWKNGIDTLDIFANMETTTDTTVEPYAYKEFVLSKNQDTHLTENFHIEIEGDYVELVENEDGSIYHVNNDGDYVVKLKALQTGTSTVKAIWGNNDEYSAEFTLTVTANLAVEANPNSFILASGATGKSTLTATSKEDTTKDYSKANKLTWNAVASTKISEEGDVGVSMSSNVCNISSYGLNAQITVSATYDYHGHSYSASTVIDVLRNGAVGLSDSTSYNEADIVEATETERTINGSLITNYDSSTEPTNESTYFLYEINSNDFVKTHSENITITATTTTGEEIPNLVIEDLDLDNITENTNGFKTTPFDVYYYSSDLDSSIEGTITATIVNGNDTYVLKLENVKISPKPYKVTLNANGGAFVSEKESVGTKDIELTQDLDLSTLETVPIRTGYTLTGWYSDEACSEDKKVEQITLADVRPNLTIYAKWEPVTTKMKFDRNFDPEDETARVVEKDIAYDSTTLETVTRENYTFSGWMNSDNELVTDSTGKVLNQETFNQLILDSTKEGATEVTLYAKWTSLDVVFKTKVEDGDDQTFDTIRVLGGSTSASITLSDIDENYTLEGWYLLNEDGTETEVLDTIGNIVEGLNVEGYIQDGKFITSENGSITLYAKWIQKKQAYVLVDSFENGKAYILATSNDGSGKAMNSSFTGTNVTISTDRNSQKYIETDESNILWTYNNQYLKINGKYLYGYIDNDWDWNYKLKLNSIYSQWNYSDHKLSTSYYLSKRYGYQDVYIYYSGSSFGATNYYRSHYELDSDFYLYTLSDIEVETFEYVNAIDTQNEEDNASEEVTLETQDETSYTLVDDLTVVDEEVPTDSEAPVSTEETYTEEIAEEENTEVVQETVEEVQESTESE